MRSSGWVRVGVVGLALLGLRLLGLPGECAASKTKELLAGVGEHACVAIDLPGDCDDVIFLPGGVVVAVEKGGTVKISGKLHAYRAESGEHLWDTEVEIGQRNRTLDEFVWIDEAAGLMFAGNGPLTALECATGKVLWTKEFKEVGLVSNVTPGRNRVFVYGTKKPGISISVTGNPDKARQEAADVIGKLLKDPKLICLDKRSGELAWQVEMDPFPDSPLAAVFVPMTGDGGPYPELDSGRTVICGKKLMGIENADGSMVWEHRSKPKTIPAVGERAAFVNFDGKVASVDIASGEELWRGEDNVGKKAHLHEVSDQMIVAIDPGEYKPEDDVFSGSYKITRIAAADGKAVGSVIKGNDLQGYPEFEGLRLALTDKKATRAIDLATGEEETYEREREESCGWFVDGRILEIAEKEITCRDAASKDVVWSLALDRSKHGGGLLRSVLALAMNLNNALAQSIQVGRRAGYTASGSQSYVAYGSAQDVPRVTFSRKCAAVGLLGLVLVWPTHEDGVVGIPIAHGTPAWRIPTKDKDPWTYFSPVGSTVAIVDKKVLRVARL